MFDELSTDQWGILTEYQKIIINFNIYKICRLGLVSLARAYPSIWGLLYSNTYFYDLAQMDG